MKKSEKTLYQRIFCDTEGNIVVAQFPNAPLILWIVFTVLGLPDWSAQIDSGLGALANAFLFVWAYLEITSGINYFRRALGGLIMTFMVLAYFA